MTGVIPTERLFSLACFEGLKLVRTYAAQQPDLTIPELIDLIEKVDSDGPNLDLEAGAYLHGLVDADCPLVIPTFYQSCIKVVVIRHQPIWAKAMRQGRKRFVATLQQNDQDVFAAAGFMKDPPDADVVYWWDDVAGHARLILDGEKMQQGREAEKLTIDLETKRLAQIGIEKKPVWSGLDDNFAGYDVLSYDIGEDGEFNRLIEVKSTIASPLRFNVTRNEWEKAKQAGSAYIFHVWDMAQHPPVLHVRTVEQVAIHIPDDNEDGKWTNTLVPVS